MTTAKLYDLARMTTATTGTGTITLGSAVTGFLSFAGAGVADGDTVVYAIADGANSEIGTGVYTASGTTLTRSVIKSTNSNAAINLSGSAQVFISPSASFIPLLDSSGRLGIGTSSPTTQVEAATQTTTTNRGFTTSQYTSDAASAFFLGKKARGTLSAPTIVLNGDYITGYVPSPYDGVNFIQTGFIGYQVNGTVAGGSIPSDFVLFTGTSGNGTLKLTVTSAGATQPGADNSYTLGSASFRWSQLYAGTSTINTSDAREKTAVGALTDAELTAAKRIAKEVGTYQFLDAVALKGTAARIHVGITVQRVIEIMQSCGLDPFRYGFICHDQWSEQPARAAVVDKDGAVVMPATPGRAAGDRYGFRVEELLLFLARGFDARLSALEAKV